MNSSLLLENLDDLPSLMHVVQSAPASPRRFRSLVNNSLSMEETLQDNTQPKTKKSTSYTKYGTNIIRQASKHLMKDKPLDNKSKPKRDIGEIARLAKESLISKANSGDPRNLFRNFDESRNGYVTYEDFNQALLATNAGLSKREAFLLAKVLDGDQNGILDYTELTSSLSSVCEKYSSQKPNRIDTQELDRDTQDSPKSHLSLPSPSSSPPIDPVAEGYQRAYEYGLKYLRKTQEHHEQFEKNERMFYQSLGPDIEIPYSQRIFYLSSLQPPRSTDFNKSYHRGSGNVPSTMADHLNGVLVSTATEGESNRNRPAVDVESESNSYSEMYLKARVNRPENEATGVTKSYNGRHITGAGPLSTTAVTNLKGADTGGPVGTYERAFYGNPTNPTNRSSRDFTNAFIIDQAKPIRRKKRSSSAPPTRPLDNNSLRNSLQKQTSSESGGNSPPPLPVDCQSSIEKNPRAHFDLSYEQTNSDGVNTALHAVIPPHESYLDTHTERKKRVHPLPINSNLDQNSSIQMSLNTLLSQTNSYSKMKILEHKMKQFDLSHSGYINKSEFISSLARSGVHLTPEQAHIIFESHAQEPKCKTNNSVRLSDHDTRAIPISEFINKLQTRISTPGLQKKFLKEHPTSVSPTKGKTVPFETPLQKSDQLNWKKLITTLNSKQLDTKRSLELFKDIQINHNNQIPPDAFLRELHSLGVPLDDIEYRNLISNVRKTSNGNLDLSDFSKQLYIKNQQFLKEEETIALMPSLEHSKDTLSKHYEIMKMLEKQSQNDETNRSIKRYSQQKKHFANKQGKETFYDQKHSRNEYIQLFQQNLHSHQSTDSSVSSVPTCLLNGNTIDTKRERLRWFKMKDNILNKRNELLKSFGGVEHIHQSYTPAQIRDKFAQVGVQLGDDDFKLFHSYVQNASNSTKSTINQNNSLNFEQICDSLGVTVQTDSARRSRAVCNDDCQRDGGIFGASEKSLLSHPTYRVNMLSSSLDDTAFGRGNRKRHYNPITGESLDPSATSQLKISTSEFWEMKHIPEIKGIPGNLRRSRNDESFSGHKYQGTSLRDLQKQNHSRRRSNSAPPAASRNQSSANPNTVSPKPYLWQNQGEKKPYGTRFASTPLAQYLKLRHGDRFDHEPSTSLHYLPVDQQIMTPMRTSELNSSIASSISFHKDDPSSYSLRGAGGRGGYVITESHDLHGNEATEIETNRGRS